MQENIMLIANDPTITFIGDLGNDVYVTTPWVMCHEKSHQFVDGVISFHNSKTTKSYLSGRITDVINLGRIDNRHRVAFVFKQGTKTINPTSITKRYANTLTQTREQVRY